jgi:hypothetical protein
MPTVHDRTDPMPSYRSEPPPTRPTDSRRASTAAADSGAQDWHLLFRAVLEVLARVAVEKPAPDAAGPRLQAPGNVLREGLAALEQLRRSVPPPRQG